MVLVQIRREHQVLEAAKPFIQILTENRCSTGYDLLYNVRGIGELVSWTIPRPLALSIYDVLEQIHNQTARIGTRNILREMYVGAGFDKFLRERESRASDQTTHQLATAAPIESSSEEDMVQTAPHRPSSPDLSSMKDEIRARLEKDVLMLPIQDIELLSAADVLFKAAFLVCGEVVTVPSHEPRSANATIDAFLDSLVAFRLEGEALALRQLIRDRVSTAKRIADEQAATLKRIGVKSASDLVVRTLCE